MAITKLNWNGLPGTNYGTLIDVSISNSADVTEANRQTGLEGPPPATMKALIDTGASVTLISKVYANHCKLFQTGDGGEITVIGSTLLCGEHAGAITFPGTGLKPFSSIRIVSADLFKEPHFACLLGRDVLRHWKICFDGPGKMVTIED